LTSISTDFIKVYEALDDDEEEENQAEEEDIYGWRWWTDV